MAGSGVGGGGGGRCQGGEVAGMSDYDQRNYIANGTAVTFSADKSVRARLEKNG